MTGGRVKKKQARRDSSSLQQNASLENHLRLQQSQEEFLKWLEANEVRPEVDRYAYKKIR